MSQVAFPSPTLEEERQLRIMINRWETHSPLQRAIGTALIRGHDSPEAVALYLGVSVDEVRSALRGLWGILLHHGANKLWFK